jgi:dihydropteroate synthase
LLLSYIVLHLRAIKDVHKECIISIDTRKSEVAQAAIEANAEIVNDVSGGRFDPNMLEVVTAEPYVSIIMIYTINFFAVTY